MKKAIILISVLAGLTLCLFIGTKLIKQEDDMYISDYLEDDGFVYDEEGQFYKKVKSEITMSEYFETFSKYSLIVISDLTFL